MPQCGSACIRIDSALRFRKFALREMRDPEPRRTRILILGKAFDFILLLKMCIPQTVTLQKSCCRYLTWKLLVPVLDQGSPSLATISLEPWATSSLATQ
jgi:hypothetical protein